MRVLALGREAPESVDLALRAQPKLVLNRREYAMAKNLALAGRPESLREILRELAHELAKDSVRYWLDYLGVKPGKGGAPKKESFTESKAYPIGREVEAIRKQFEQLFTLKSQLSQADLRRQLGARKISSADIDIILTSRNANAAACRSVAVRSDLNPKTVRNYCLQYRLKRTKN
jgi:hypothetical protein